ncbi:MAG: alpha/beta hydrolase [Microbacteriaceae bacterium]
MSKAPRSALSAAELAAWPHVFREAAGGAGVDADAGTAGATGTAGALVFVALHGTGGTEHDLVTLADALDPEAAVLAPRGRTSENGLNRWFARRGEGVFDVDDVIERAGELADFIEWATAHYGLEGRTLILVGFSNGANIALATAFLHPRVAPRALAFSGMYPFADRVLNARLDSSTVLLVGGTDDPMAPARSVSFLVSELERAGAVVSAAHRPGGHGIAVADVERAREWLAAL